jgi:hypothetical protein
LLKLVVGYDGFIQTVVHTVCIAQVIISLQGCHPFLKVVLLVIRTGTLNSFFKILNGFMLLVNIVEVTDTYFVLDAVIFGIRI